eukprot:TRINITY_DN1822_c0_g1_i1.p1 TRINITY_DN1822_c0_g1~~TRINITY_DN1822_c0_g1_i1.p1  ORF type:complete len:120 (-),score=51.56 TRINITY_DN1822_c0_g1_i1:105-464(-)
MEEVVISPSERLGLASAYASLILHDGKKDIDSKNLQSVAKAAGIELDNFWAGVFENVLKGFDLNTLLENTLGGGAGSGPVQGGSAPVETKTEVKEEVKKVEEKVEEESASIGGLFGDDD